MINLYSTKTSLPKLVQSCTYPLTAAGVVTRVYSDLGVLEVTDQGFVVRELAPGVSLAELQERCHASIRPASFSVTS